VNPEASGYLRQGQGSQYHGNNASLLSNRARELRTELARKIASFMGSQENRATDIRGVTLHRRIAPTAPCSAT